jgi:nicotinamide riboside kinase
MEKKSESLIRIVVTGPESTGKTSISDFLANHFNAVWIPEYARYYISSLRNKYDYSDIEKIARKQIEDYHNYSDTESGIVIFDTWLIITKIWFVEVFKRYPDWLNNAINTLRIDLYLICSPDIPWEPDIVRENGGDARLYLFDRYCEEILKLGCAYSIISGTGEARMQSALKAIEDFKSKEK